MPHVSTASLWEQKYMLSQYVPAEEVALASSNDDMTYDMVYDVSVNFKAIKDSSEAFWSQRPLLGAALSSRQLPATRGRRTRVRRRCAVQ